MLKNFRLPNTWPRPSSREHGSDLFLPPVNFQVAFIYSFNNGLHPIVRRGVAATALPEHVLHQALARVGLVRVPKMLLDPLLESVDTLAHFLDVVLGEEFLCSSAAVAGLAGHLCGRRLIGLQERFCS